MKTSEIKNLSISDDAFIALSNELEGLKYRVRAISFIHGNNRVIAYIGKDDVVLTPGGECVQFVDYVRINEKRLRELKHVLKLNKLAMSTRGMDLLEHWVSKNINV